MRASSQQLERVRADFKRYDANGDGTLTVAEFRKAMEPYFTPEDFKKLLKEINPGGNSTISWKEFLTVTPPSQASQLPHSIFIAGKSVHV